MLVSAPESYGLTEAQTLAHTVDEEPPAAFEPYWATLREEIGTLPVRWQGSVDGEANEFVIPSLRSVRVVARLTMPEDAAAGIRGVVIVVGGDHHEAVFPPGPEPWTDERLATLRLHVRGYPPSTQDLPDSRGAWIMHHLRRGDAWIMRGAVADVVQAARCASHHFGESMPIGLYGESLGGGLVTMAAAQMTSIPGAPAPHRMVLSLPSCGAWRWRAGRYCNGLGRLVNEELVAARQDSERVIEILLLFDAALHAPRVTCPVLSKLALRDDVVPAPSAAAVHNALPPAGRHRHLTRFGHFDGGLADARRHVLFERAHPGFLNPDRDIQQTISDLSDSVPGDAISVRPAS